MISISPNFQFLSIGNQTSFSHRHRSENSSTVFESTWTDTIESQNLSSEEQSLLRNGSANSSETAENSDESVDPDEDDNIDIDASEAEADSSQANGSNVRTFEPESLNNASISSTDTTTQVVARYRNSSEGLRPLFRLLRALESMGQYHPHISFSLGSGEGRIYRDVK